jgi:hypothetical protein
MIPSEILAAYDSAGIQPDSRSLLANVLVQADYVKFAKAIPIRSENEQSLAYARQLIETTKPIAVETKNSNDTSLQTTDTETKA